MFSFFMAAQLLSCSGQIPAQWERQGENKSGLSLCIVIALKFGALNTIAGWRVIISIGRFILKG